MKGLAVALFLLSLWQVAVWMTGVPPFILPGPLAVLRAATGNAGLLAEHALVTAAEILLGFTLGVALGTAMAGGMSLSGRLCRLLHPALVVSQAVPIFALAPILTLWLGYGMASKVAVVVLIVVFPVASALHDGLRATPEGSLDLARLAGAGRGRTLLWLRLPHAVPFLGAALRIAAVYAPIGAVIGEWVGASRGLGYLMLLSNARMKTDLMFAALCLLAALTLALRGAVGALALRLEAGRRD